jgi:hypothetical protein
MTLPATFWSHTRRSDCVIWFGAVNTKGYPCVNVDGRSQLAHRLAYEDAVGPIPDGYTIDHLCRVRNCVNPDHLEVVTVAENNRRKRTIAGLQIGGECIRGHQITELTAYRHPRGHIECRECRRRKPHRVEAATP